MSNNALQTIINAQLPGKEGLWQIHLHDGKISAIDAQSGVKMCIRDSPSDNLGGILATADWLSRNAIASGKAPLTMKQVLTGMIKAHEIQAASRWKTPLTALVSTTFC